MAQHQATVLLSLLFTALLSSLPTGCSSAACDTTELKAHPTDCTIYVQCVHGSTLDRKCGPGTVFNPKVSVCDWPYNVPNCGKGTTGTTKSSCQGVNCNNGDCVTSGSSYRCECKTGWRGTFCSKRVPNPCEGVNCNNGFCVVEGNAFKCQCYNGYTGYYCNTRSQGKNPCDGVSCNNGNCIVNGNGHYCQCNQGFTGTSCQQREDPCKGINCNNGKCQVYNNGFVCQCENAYTGTYCTTRKPTVDPCQSINCNNGQCRPNGESFYCQCSKGYSGFYCNTRDVADPCKGINCNKGKCMPNGNTYYCSCNTGFTGIYCNQQQSDPCKDINCNNGQCIRNGESYYCRCMDGYAGFFCQTRVQGSVCQGVNCNNGQCVVNGNNYYCRCNEGFTGASCNQVAQTQTSNLIELARSRGLNEFLRYAAAAGLMNALTVGGPYTLFVPRDSAFTSLPQAVQQKLTYDPTLLASVLKYHITNGVVKSSNLRNELLATSLYDNRNIRMNIYDGPEGKIYLAEGSRIMLPDQIASNGVIHVIDELNYPLPEGTVTDLVAKDNRFTTLLAAVQRANLGTTLAGIGPFTVFAPTNEAFSKLPAGALNRILADFNLLTALLKFHVVQGTKFSKGLQAQQYVPSLGGSNLVVSRSQSDAVTVGNARVTEADVPCTNGVVHVIDTVLIPPQLAPYFLG